MPNWLPAFSPDRSRAGEFRSGDSACENAGALGQIDRADFESSCSAVSWILGTRWCGDSACLRSRRRPGRALHHPDGVARTALQELKTPTASWKWELEMLGRRRCAQPNGTGLTQLLPRARNGRRPRSTGFLLLRARALPEWSSTPRRLYRGRLSSSGGAAGHGHHQRGHRAAAGPRNAMTKFLDWLVPKMAGFSMTTSRSTQCSSTRSTRVHFQTCSLAFLFGKLYF